MKRTLASLALLALVLVTTATAATPAAGGPTRTLVIKVKSVTVKVSTTDAAPKGVSKGDRYRFRDRLLNAARQFGKPVGALVGGDQGFIVLTSKTTGRTRGIATLPGGTISFGGEDGVAAMSYPIVGGTGRYADARGVLLVGPGDSPLNTYRLSLPAKPGGTLVSAHPAAGGKPTALVVSLRSVETGSTADDRAPQGLSKGDRWVIRDRLINVTKQFGKPRGAVVGHDRGQLVFTSATAATFTGVTVLPGGTLRIHGVLHVSGAGTRGTVDGGTGRFAHATGFIVIGSGPNPLNVYHLELPAASAGATV
jgi:hypothetical protein